MATGRERGTADAVAIHVVNNLFASVCPMTSSICGTMIVGTWHSATCARLLATLLLKEATRQRGKRGKRHAPTPQRHDTRHTDTPCRRKTKMKAIGLEWRLSALTSVAKVWCSMEDLWLDD